MIAWLLALLGLSQPVTDTSDLDGAYPPPFPR